jgi:hypothetical protein
MKLRREIPMALYLAGSGSIGDFTYQVVHSFWEAFPVRKDAIELNPHWFAGLAKAVHVILSRRIETVPGAGFSVTGIPLRDRSQHKARADVRRGKALETDQAFMSLLWEIEREMRFKLTVITHEPAIRLKGDVRDAVESGIKPFLCRKLSSTGIEKSPVRPPARLEAAASR